MKRVIWTKRQKKQLIHDVKCDFYNLYYHIDKWMSSCENLTQLNNTMCFAVKRINHYIDNLNNRIVLLGGKYVNSEINYLSTYISHVLEEKYKEKCTYLSAEYEKSTNYKEPVVVKGFC